MSGSSGSSRRSFKSQIHVKGRYGTELVCRVDEPEVGYGRTHAAVTFDGVVDYNNDPYFGYITVDEDSLDTVVDDIGGRVDEYEVVTLVEDS